ncbi:MAG: class A beta-lactamase-related serine hydrolase [Bdellovibrionaceae bacterium]|nr:class A beta-lactamase-related serine hydrolase [Pseudobdellovibrionaceae bacterium]
MDDSGRSTFLVASLLTGAAFGLFLVAALTWKPARAQSAPTVLQVKWPKTVRKKLARLESRYPKHIGVYIKDLSGGDVVSHRADESWYLASGVKVPIAIEAFRRVDTGDLTLDETLELGPDDFVDGAGETNSHAPGKRLSVRYLLEQMLIHSDNTASDLLIRRLGLENLNASVREWTAGAFAPISTLSDVRRYAYGGLHPAALGLRNRDFLHLKAVHGDRAKREAFLRLAQVEASQLKSRSLAEAFAKYYARHINSASLRAYGDLLERLFAGELLSPTSTRELGQILARVVTGQARIKAGLPRGFEFAHKTGTQFARTCDFGVISHPARAQHRVLVAACVRDIASLAESEAILRQIGEAISESGVLSSPDGAREVLVDDSVDSSAYATHPRI